MEEQDTGKEILKDKIREKIVVKNSRWKIKLMLIFLGCVISFLGAYLLDKAIFSANIWIIAWVVLVMITGFILIFLGLILKEKK